MISFLCVADVLIQLDADIQDPERLVVNDTDFAEIKRQNPNLGQLIVLERKKENEEQRPIRATLLEETSNPRESKKMGFATADRT